jgi:hypothetical protein
MAEIVAGLDQKSIPRELRTDPAGRLIPSLIRPITTPLSGDVDLTKDPADGTTILGPAGGIYSSGGGAVAVVMSGSTTSSTLTLAPGGSRQVSITKLLQSGTTATGIEVSW